MFKKAMGSRKPFISKRATVSRGVMLFKFSRIVIFTALFLLSAMMVMKYWLYEYRFKKALPLLNEIYYEVNSGKNLSDVAKDLVQKEMMDYPSAVLWVAAARWDNKAHRIKAGEYAIPVGTTPEMFLNILIGGKTIEYSLTLVEGWTFKQIMTAVNNNIQLKHTLKSLDDKTIMKRLGFPDVHPEGRFYPDTYIFTRNISDVDFLRRAYNAMDKKLAEVWAQRQAKLPLKDKYEALILASIIEKETGAPGERPEIAGVFIRRLEKNMLLQTDPTVIYGLGEAYTGNITRQDLKIDSPYNTYRYKGLPPTPIASPGLAALKSAVNPKQGDSFYFVSTGNGNHHFSASLKEHGCAVIKYQIKKPLPEYCLKYPLR
jgi:UPF0755 protein